MTDLRYSRMAFRIAAVGGLGGESSASTRQRDSAWLRRMTLSSLTIRIAAARAWVTTKVATDCPAMTAAFSMRDLSRVEMRANNLASFPLLAVLRTAAAVVMQAMCAQMTHKSS